MELLNTFKLKLKQARGLFPSRLPVGKTEFEQWSDSIIELYSPPGDKRSIKFGLCALLMRLNQTEAFKSKAFFALCLYKGAAAQVAAYVMEEIKAEQRAEYEAAEKSRAEAIDVQVQNEGV